MRKIFIVLCLAMLILPSMLTQATVRSKQEPGVSYMGLSTDTKPTTFQGATVLPGALFFEEDTRSTYFYDGSSWILKSGVSVGTDVNMSPTAAGINDQTDTTSVISYGYDRVSFSFTITDFTANINALLEFSDNGTAWFLVTDSTTSTQYTANGTYSLVTEDSAPHAFTRLRVSTMASGAPLLAIEKRAYKQE